IIVNTYPLVSMEMVVNTLKYVESLLMDVDDNIRMAIRELDIGDFRIINYINRIINYINM
ncbi:hypothetical protein L9F63_013761, partial [Diploptera punctata]